MPDNVQLGFAEILDMYNDARDMAPEFQQMELPEFSQWMNEATNSRMFDSGLSDNFIKRSSVAFDELITPITKVTGEVGAAAGRPFGPTYEAVGKELGTDIPRTTMEMMGIGALAVPLLAGSEVTVPAAILGALGAGSAFAHGYTRSGAGEGLLNVGMGFAAPGVGQYSRYAVAPLLKKVLPAVGEKSAMPVLERAFEFLAAESGMFALNEVTRQAQMVSEGQGLTMPTGEDIFANVLGLVPFLPWEATHLARGPRKGQFRSVTEYERSRAMLKRIEAEKQVSNQQTVIERDNPLGTAVEQEFERFIRGYSFDPESARLEADLDRVNGLLRTERLVDPETLETRRLTKVEMEQMGAIKKMLDEALDLRRQQLPLRLFGERPGGSKYKVENLSNLSEGLKKALAEGRHLLPDGRTEVLEATHEMNDSMQLYMLDFSDPEGLKGQLSKWAENELSKGTTTEEEVAYATLQKIEDAAEKLLERRDLELAQDAKAAAWMSALPEPIRRLVTEGIAEFEQGLGSSYQRVNDLMARFWPDVAEKWYRLHGEKVAQEASVMTPIPKGKEFTESVEPTTGEVNAAAFKSDLKRYLNASLRGIMSNVLRGSKKEGVLPIGEAVPQSAFEEFVEVLAGIREGQVTPDEGSTRVTQLMTEYPGLSTEAAHATAKMTDKAENPQSRWEFLVEPLTEKEIVLGAAVAGVADNPKSREKFRSTLEDVWEKMKTYNERLLPRGELGKKMKAATDIILASRMGEKGYTFHSSVRTAIEEIGKKYGLGKKLAPGPLDELALGAAAKEFAKEYFRRTGMDKDKAADMADIFQRIAVAFDHVEQTRIAELTGTFAQGKGGYLATYSGPGRVGILGLALGNITNVGKDSPFVLMEIFAHELVHRRIRAVESPNDTHDARVIRNLLQTISEADDDLKRGLLRDLMATVIPEKADVGQKFLFDYALSDPEEFAAVYGSLLAVGVVSPSPFKPKTITQLRDHIKFSDVHYQEFARGMYQDARALTQLFKDFAILSGEKSSTPRTEFVHAVHDTLGELLKTTKEIELATRRLALTESMFPANYVQLVGKAHAGWVGDASTWQFWARGGGDFLGSPEDIKNMSRMMGILQDKDAARFGGKMPNWFERNIMPPAQLRELYKELQDMTDLAYGYRGHINHFLSRMSVPFGRMGTGKMFGKVVLDKEAPIHKVARDTKMREAFSKTLLRQNTEKKMFTDDDVRKVTEEVGLDKDKQDTVIQLVQQHRQAMRQAVDVILEYHKQAMGDTLGGLFMAHVEGLEPRLAISYGERFVKSVFNAGATQKPEIVAQAKAELESLQKVLGPEASNAAIQSMDRMLQGTDGKGGYARLAKSLHDNYAHYASEVRLGKWMVSWKDKGDQKTGLFGFEKQSEAVEFANKLDKAGHNDIHMFDKWNQRMEARGVKRDMLQKFIAQETDYYTEALKQAAAAGGDPDTIKTIKELFTPGQAIMEEATLKGFEEHQLQATRAHGREMLDFLDGTIGYIEGLATGLAKATTKRRASLLLRSPKLKENPALRKHATDYVMSVVDPPRREWSRFKKAAFFYFMGGNLSSVIVESAQPIFTLIPEMVRRGSGWGKAYHTLAKANGALLRIRGGKASGVEGLEDALRRAHEEQAIDMGVYQELVSLDEESSLLSLRRLSKGGEAIDPTQLVKKPIYWLAKMAEDFYRGATSRNSQLAFVTGFMEGKRQGMDSESAYAFGKRMTESTMFGGGAAARPGFFYNLKSTYGAVGALYTLRHFTVSTLAMVYRNLKESIDRGLPKSERSAAQKALATQMTTQLLASGALGMPMASGMLAVMGQLFPELKLEQDIMQTISNLAGDDEETGALFSDIALNGILSALPGAPDLQARFGLGDAFGIDPANGITGSTFFGAAGGLIERYVKGLNYATTGEKFEAFRQFAPNSIANFFKVWHDGWKVRNRRGELLYEPNFAEKVFGAIGLKPTMLTRIRTKQELQDKADEVAGAQQRRFHRSVADLAEMGDFAGARQVLLEMGANDETYDVRAGSRSVADMLVKRSVPVDPNRTGLRSGATEREKVARLIRPAHRVKPPTEVELYHLKKQVERQIGIPGTGVPSKRGLTVAMMVDRLMAMNPTLSRQRALMIVETQLGVSSPYQPRGGSPTQ